MKTDISSLCNFCFSSQNKRKEFTFTHRKSKSHWKTGVGWKTGKQADRDRQIPHPGGENNNRQPACITLSGDITVRQVSTNNSPHLSQVNNFAMQSYDFIRLLQLLSLCPQLRFPAAATSAVIPAPGPRVATFAISSSLFFWLHFNVLLLQLTTS